MRYSCNSREIDFILQGRRVSDCKSVGSPGSVLPRFYIPCVSLRRLMVLLQWLKLSCRVSEWQISSEYYLQVPAVESVPRYFLFQARNHKILFP
jgi:hypothetical protein